MNRKAFTLVELLAVIVILGIILSIISVSVFNILEDSKENAYETQIEMLKASTKEYVSDKKRTLFSEKDNVCISIYDLYQERYITEIPEDTKTGKKMSEHLGFIVKKDGDSITYTLVKDIYEEAECK